MGFLKTFFIGTAVLLLNACTGKVAQQSQPEATPSVSGQPATMPSQASSKTLPSFIVKDANGNTIDLQRFKGKKVFVNLWATWCPPCRAEMPSIEKLYQAADKEKAQFVLLSLDNDFETAKKYVQANNMKVPIFFPAGDVPELFTVNGIPTTFIFDESGKLTEQHEGSEDYNTAAYRSLFGARN